MLEKIASSRLIRDRSCFVSATRCRHHRVRVCFCYVTLFVVALTFISRRLSPPGNEFSRAVSATDTEKHGELRSLGFVPANFNLSGFPGLSADFANLADDVICLGVLVGSPFFLFFQLCLIGDVKW